MRYLAPSEPAAKALVELPAGRSGRWAYGTDASRFAAWGMPGGHSRARVIPTWRTAATAPVGNITAAGTCCADTWVWLAPLWPQAPPCRVSRRGCHPDPGQLLVATAVRSVHLRRLATRA